MRRWMKADLLPAAYKRLPRLDRRRRRPRYRRVDSSVVKNFHGIECVGRKPTDRGRKATRLSAAADDTGVPFCALLAWQPDMHRLHATLEAAIVLPTLWDERGRFQIASALRNRPVRDWPAWTTTWLFFSRTFLSAGSEEIPLCCGRVTCALNAISAGDDYKGHS